MPADFHGMAMMDVLVVTRSDSLFQLYLVRGDKSSLNCSTINAEQRLATVASEPLLFDYNNDMVTDILAQSATNESRYVWVSKNGTFEATPAFGTGN